MGHEKKKKRDRDKDKDRDKERKKRSRSRSGSVGGGGGAGGSSDGERRHRRRHKKHRSSRHRRREQEPSPPTSPTQQVTGQQATSSRHRRREQEPSPPPSPTQQVTGQQATSSRHRRREQESSPPPSPAQQVTGQQAPSSRHRRREQEPSPPPSPAQQVTGQQAPSGDGHSLSIQETNKLRAQLGLKPLDVSSEPADGGAADGEAASKLGSSDRTAIHARPENMGERRRTERLRERIKERKEQRALESRVGRGRRLAEPVSDDESAADWVSRSRRLQTEKEQAQKRAALLDDLDAEFGVGDIVTAEADAAPAYTPADLRGLTVQHSAADIREGRATVLTLQDADLLDEKAQDVLVNVNMADDERASKNAALRKQKPGYRPDDQDEWDEHGNFKPKSMLSQYDEELDGEKKQSFTIGEAIPLSGAAAAAAETAREHLQMGVKRSLQSLQMPAPRRVAEFYTEAEMTSFKKVKKKVRKVRKRALKADDLLDGAEQLESHLGARTRDRRTADGEDVEPAQAITTDDTEPLPDLSGVPLETEEADDELARAIERSRRLRQQQQQEQDEPASGEVRLAALAAKLREEDDSEDDTAPHDIVLNSTAEFCRSLGDIPTYGMAGNRAAADAAEAAALERELAEERRLAEQQTHPQEGGTWAEVSADGSAAPADLGTTSALQTEPQIGTGLAGALHLAQNKGYVDQEATGKKGASKQVLTHLRAQNYSIEDKSAADEDRRGRGSTSYNGPVTEFREKHNYAPAVKLEYIDDQGRLLSSKEAFRYLSHKFHGKGSGKMKTEKREKKYQEQLSMAHMSSADTPLHTLERLQQKQKQLSSPYVVLSGQRLLGSGKEGSQVAKN